MRYDLVRPCAQCPFRTDISGYLTPGRAEEIAEAITELQQTFACHKTVDYGDDAETCGARYSSKNEQHCAGAMILLEKLEMPNQMMRIAERFGMYDRRRLDMESPVVDDVDSFVLHHEEAYYNLVKPTAAPPAEPQTQAGNSADSGRERKGGEE